MEKKERKQRPGFFRYVFASMLGFIFGYIVIIIVSFSLVLGIVSFVANKATNHDKEIVIKENTVLKITLDRPIVERIDESNPFYQLADFGDEFTAAVALKDVIDNIERAANDENILGIILDLKMPMMSYASLEEIRNALLKFKESGKFIYSYSDIYTEGTYYLASVADSIFMQPEGMFLFDGFQMDVTYFRGMLDKLNIKPTVLRYGKYKSAAEMAELTKMSDAQRQQLEEYLFPMYADYLSKISEQTGIDTASLRQYADNLEIILAKDAADKKLVHKLMYKDEYIDFLKSKVGEEPHGVSLYTYIRAEKEDYNFDTDNEIAIIYATGNIVMGEGSVDMIGSDGLSKAIRKARKDDNIKAIVLRINSGGGSALASDIIWREVKLAQEKKPVVVSMGDVAASGGYYIACAADKIVAQPNTITGSIGVIGLHLNTEKFWEEKLGVTFDQVKTNKYSDFMSPLRELSDYEYARMIKGIDDIYQSFIGKVAEGRNMTPAEVDSIGQGRVWRGERAKEIGLVDEMGGLNDAIKIAQDLAEIEEYNLKILPKYKNPFEEFFKAFNTQLYHDKMMSKALGDEYYIYEQAMQIKNLEGIQTRMPFEIRIK